MSINRTKKLIDRRKTKLNKTDWADNKKYPKCTFVLIK